MPLNVLYCVSKESEQNNHLENIENKVKKRPESQFRATKRARFMLKI